MSNPYLDLFRQERSTLEGHSLPLLNEHREAAALAFERLGLPSQRLERYKYTDVKGAFAPNYGLKWDTPISQQPLPSSIASLYGTLADVNADGLTALNTMLVQDLLLIHIPAGVHKEVPIQVSHTLRSAVPLMLNRRVLIVAEEGASAQMIFHHHAEAGQDFLTTQVTELFVGKGANVELYDIEDTSERCHRFHQLFADVSASAHLTHASIALAGGLLRNQTDVKLSGQGSRVELLGCAVLGGQQHVDNNTLIDHQAPGCESNELYKYVVDQQATGAFAGRILVREQAQQTESHETNANLVCTPEARMYAQPMLEIYADDVQCSHGSTVGQLSDDALFYMRQRGISEAEARTLLKQAFASEVIQRIPLEPLAARLHHLVEKRFRSCDDCKLCNKLTS